jgi:hypothetical protein
MSKLLAPARKLQEFPILHRFVTYFIVEHMSEVALIYPNVFEELAHYEVAEYCSCMECGTFYLKTPSEENIFSYFNKVNDDMFFMKDIGGHVFLPKMYVNPETGVCDPTDIDFEIVAGDYDIHSYPYAKELLEDKRDTSDEEAWKLVHDFFKDKKEEEMQIIFIDDIE